MVDAVPSGKRRAHNAPDLTAPAYPACLDNSPPPTLNRRPRPEQTPTSRPRFLALFFRITVLSVHYTSPDIRGALYPLEEIIKTSLSLL